MYDSRQKIENYLNSLLPDEPATLQELREKTKIFGAGAVMNVGPFLGAYLEFFVRSTQIKNILEIGTFTGYSTLCFARALPSNGKITTLDRDQKAPAIAKEMAEKAGLTDKIEFLINDAMISIQQIASDIQTNKRPKFDMVFIDADKIRYSTYWDQCVDLVRDHGFILADNILRDGGSIDPQDDGDRAIQAFNLKVKSDARFHSYFLPIRDGLLIAQKTN